MHKPDPRVFEPILARLAERQVQPQDITYVGDHVRDYQAARDAGLAFVGMAHTADNQAAFDQAGAEWVDSFAELGERFLALGE